MKGHHLKQLIPVKHRVAGHFRALELGCIWIGLCLYNPKGARTLIFNYRTILFVNCNYEVKAL